MSTQQTKEHFDKYLTADALISAAQAIAASHIGRGTVHRDECAIRCNGEYPTVELSVHTSPEDFEPFLVDNQPDSIKFVRVSFGLWYPSVDESPIGLFSPAAKKYNQHLLLPQYRTSGAN